MFVLTWGNWDSGGGRWQAINWSCWQWRNCWGKKEKYSLSSILNPWQLMQLVSLWQFFSLSAKLHYCNFKTSYWFWSLKTASLIYWLFKPRTLHFFMDTQHIDNTNHCFSSNLRYLYQLGDQTPLLALSNRVLVKK